MHRLIALGALLFTTTAIAEEAPSGFAQMVDSPALKAAFTKASTGEVELAVDVAADGTIEHARIIRSAPSGIFDAAALDMIAGRHLHPATKDGTPVPVKDLRLTLRFAAQADPPASVEQSQ